MCGVHGGASRRATVAPREACKLSRDHLTGVATIHEEVGDSPQRVLVLLGEGNRSGPVGHVCRCSMKSMWEAVVSTALGRFMPETFLPAS